MTYTTSSRIHTKAARQAQLHICMHIYFICIPTPTIFTHIYNHRYMLAVPTAMLQSHGGSSLHCYPAANCLAAPFLSLSFSTTHTLNSLARPLSSQLTYIWSSVYFYIFTISSEGEDKALHHDSPYVAHFTCRDATLYCTQRLFLAAGCDAIPSLFFLLHWTPQMLIQLPALLLWMQSWWKLLWHSHIGTSPLEIAKINDSLKSNFLPLCAPSPFTQIRRWEREILTSVTWDWQK